MSEISSEDASKLIKVESELRKLQESFNALNEKYNSLNEKYLKLAAYHSSSVENSEEIEKNLDVEMVPLDLEMNHLDVDQCFKDPIKFLTESCAVEILKNLTGKELMTAMEVSKSWRDFIKVRSVLMDKIVFKPTDESCEFLINGNNDRRYKHYKGPLYIYKEFEEVLQVHVKYGFKKVCPIELFASSLETADIKTRYQINDVIPNFHFMAITQNFSRLQKLTFPVGCFQHSLAIIKAAKFPMLTHLKLTGYHSSNRIYVGEFKKFLCLFPKLQTLVLDVDHEIFIHDDTTVPDVPKIKEFSSNLYCPHLMKEFHSSLERYEVKSIDGANLSYILSNFKRLKYLSITSILYKGDGIKFETNNSIETFCIGGIAYLARQYRSSNINRFLMDILVALPSVKKLLLRRPSADIIKFIANNMLNLKQLGCCHAITSELREAYEEIRRNPENFLNTEFEFIAYMPWDKIEL